MTTMTVRDLYHHLAEEAAFVEQQIEEARHLLSRKNGLLDAYLGLINAGHGEIELPVQQEREDDAPLEAPAPAPAPAPDTDPDPVPVDNPTSGTAPDAAV